MAGKLFIVNVIVFDAKDDEQPVLLLVIPVIDKILPLSVPVKTGVLKDPFPEAFAVTFTIV